MDLYVAVPDDYPIPSSGDVRAHDAEVRYPKVVLL
jgi:hypothetical protein